MEATPKGLRLHIGLFGRRNVGKSSLFNQLLHQDTAIVSAIPGTTTDPVEKTMEFQPLGPVVFIDTAGIDDVGSLGAQRIDRTLRVVHRTDLAILVTDGEWGDYETQLVTLFHAQKLPVILVANKSDLRSVEPTRPEIAISLPAAISAFDFPIVSLSAKTGSGISQLRQAMIHSVPDDFVNPPSILGDLVHEGELAILVVPVDKEAPKGRLILPQVQVIRDLLDHHAQAIVVQDTELPQVFARLREPPALVVTDSQAFARVAKWVPESIPMTGFSILFARYKGDLPTLAQGATAIAQLRPGAKILIGEACTHHPIGDDIGRVKIPAWLRKKVGGDVEITVAAGRDYPENVQGYDLVVHCGACVWNRREMLSRIESARAVGVPITNYGMAIAFCLGIFDRALRPFPAAIQAINESVSR